MFSIIIPIYNSEKYINETVNSVVNQSVGFLKNVEIILVDDGSTDSTPILCEKLQIEYPNNIKYVRISNSGPSKARNIGLRYVSEKSKYIGFLDSDDQLSLDALFEINLFFKSFDVKLAVLPIYYFGVKTGQHKLNYRFLKGERVINIEVEYDSPHFFIGGSFFRRVLLDEGKLNFDESVKYWEDALLINKLLIEEKKYGVIGKGKYFYRKRKEKNSIVDVVWYSKDRYIHFLNQAYIPLIKYSLKKHGIVVPYIQFLIAYHIKLFLFPKNRDLINKILTDEEFILFKNIFKQILYKIEDKIILEQDMPSYYKEFLLQLKGSTLAEFNKINLDTLKSKNVTITSMNFKGFYFMIEGHFINEYYEMKFNDKILLVSGNEKFVAKQRIIDKQIIIWGNKVRDFKYSGFQVKVPIWVYKFSFMLETNHFAVKLNSVHLINKTVSIIKKYARKLLK
ncbi:glycosyltransferase family 2 protein [Bacillus inaquosorum]|uniref:glycosyltransferase family 2 protein n=1 Tax=Bacillus inaquosorum TaxID=483913 RepID=UPI002281731D|nr:glycosyltransferase family 2 protein [Bacillus inaquosorum]MCY7961986.1 glycosyltransferase [Bacillus inaquosorum]MCY8492625.1 glycosyltransferase [Bacillus inaquosorum]MCY8695194.1 glycosyltransferase [Bacillus inaquosorum]